MYDYVVVGSSPKLILKAAQFAEDGSNVCIVEMQKELGGCWSVTELFSNEYVENACHLIEWFDGSYEKLSQLTGHSFVILNPQPKRLYVSGHEELYMSRRSILLDFFKNSISVLRLCLRVIIPGVLGRRKRFSILKTFLKSYRVYFSHRVLCF